MFEENGNTIHFIYTRHHIAMCPVMFVWNKKHQALILYGLQPDMASKKSHYLDEPDKHHFQIS